jgi:hypothetical protein
VGEGYDEGDQFLHESVTDKIRAGKSKKKNVKFKLPLGETGIGKYLIVYIDSTCLVNEANELNNFIITSPIP